MKLRYLAVLAVPALLGACSSVKTQCIPDKDICATVLRNSGMTGDMFYTSIVTQDEKIVAVVGDSQESPVFGIAESIIIGAGIVKGGAAFAKGVAAAIPEIPALPAMPPLVP